MVVCRSVGLGVVSVESYCFDLVFGFSSKRWFIEWAFAGFVFLGFVVWETNVCWCESGYSWVVSEVVGGFVPIC